MVEKLPLSEESLSFEGIVMVIVVGVEVGKLAEVINLQRLKESSWQVVAQVLLQ